MNKQMSKQRLVEYVANLGDLWDELDNLYQRLQREPVGLWTYVSAARNSIGDGLIEAERLERLME